MARRLLGCILVVMAGQSSPFCPTDSEVLRIRGGGQVEPRHLEAATGPGSMSPLARTAPQSKPSGGSGPEPASAALMCPREFFDARVPLL